jgi:hypothetical protein
LGCPSQLNKRQACPQGTIKGPFKGKLNGNKSNVNKPKINKPKFKR